MVRWNMDLLKMCDFPMHKLLNHVHLAMSFNQEWDSPMLLGRNMGEIIAYLTLSVQQRWHIVLESNQGSMEQCKAQNSCCVPFQIRHPRVEQMGRFWIPPFKNNMALKSMVFTRHSCFHHLESSCFWSKWQITLDALTSCPLAVRTPTARPSSTKISWTRDVCDPPVFYRMQPAGWEVEESL